MVAKNSKSKTKNIIHEATHLHPKTAEHLHVTFTLVPASKLDRVIERDGPGWETIDFGSHFIRYHLELGKRIADV